METEIKIITIEKLGRTIENMKKTFAPIEIAKEIIDTKVSPVQPSNQNIGDIWFVESERN
ncbi:hypothetical protein C823_007684 [Eubacterium plexicaudatum ASF492]|uniref:Uncharacterized protein n=1 Tax=Eubacterium plexicaudatum ASF492 TaxID=1235802 RepID=N2A4I4_9FIRM|nr:hypothetical protein C823_007684 [Eubacterium plexicaudatum ASF492]